MSPILVPDYVYGHMTNENLRTFVRSEVKGWGSERIPIKLFWGLPSLIEVNVSVVYPASSDSSIMVQYQHNTDENGRPKLIRTNSPLLGIPLESLTSLQDQYAKYVRDFVQNEAHLAYYARVAYEDEVSDVPGRLLGILCSWCIESKRDGDDSAMRHAIETHVICSIIERSLTLDHNSYEMARWRLKCEFPRDAAPSLVQRQLKLVFFAGQAQRIRSVLQAWGKSIRKIEHDSQNFWTTDLCVLAIMCLVMDMTIASAYSLHLHRMQANREKDDRELRKIVGVIETELFQKSKEIFHSRHKTRKGGRYNPLKDEIDPRGRDRCSLRLINELRQLVSRIGKSPVPQNVGKHSYEESGRLTRIFLSDFL